MTEEIVIKQIRKTKKCKKALKKELKEFNAILKECNKSLKRIKRVDFYTADDCSLYENEASDLHTKLRELSRRKSLLGLDEILKQKMRELSWTK